MLFVLSSCFSHHFMQGMLTIRLELKFASYLWKQVLCDGEIPFTGLVEKVEQELFWKVHSFSAQYNICVLLSATPILFLVSQAERSDLSSRPNLYKVLYSFEAHRNKWRKAAAYMYRYFVRLNREGNAGGSHQLPHVLQERLHALSAAINALQLVDPSFAWLDSICEADDKISPSKRPRNLLMENCMFCQTFNCCLIYLIAQQHTLFNFCSLFQRLLAQTQNFLDCNFVLTLKSLKKNTY